MSEAGTGRAIRRSDKRMVPRQVFKGCSSPKEWFRPARDLFSGKPAFAIGDPIPPDYIRNGFICMQTWATWRDMCHYPRSPGVALAEMLSCFT